MIKYDLQYDPVAQLVEHLTFNQVVVSSTLTRITIFKVMNVYIELIKKYISPKRVAHSERVLESALKLSKLYNANNEIIKKAALLHDIAKNQTPQSLEKLGISKALFKEEYKKYPAVWHAFVASTLIEFELPGESVPLKDAIKFHTTGKDNMSLESMIIYVADFIEPERTHPSRLKVAELSEKKLEEAVAWVTHYSLEKLKNKKVEIHPFTKKCWEYYCKYIPNSEKWHKND